MRGSEIVVTGVGVVSPIGIGREAFWAALMAGRSGVGRISMFDAAEMPVQVVAEVRDFDPKPFVANRKSLKLMARDAQLGMAAAELACRDAGVSIGSVDPERFGIVMGADPICSPIGESEISYGSCMVDGRFDFGRWGTHAMPASFPLSFLRVLPNMIASHISIAQDARGPNNTIHHCDVSGLLAMREAATVIQRGMADIMMTGGASSQMHVFDFLRRHVMGVLSPRNDDPAAVVRPFDACRDGQAWGEGAAIMVLESRQHAEARGAKVLARLLGWATACEPVWAGSGPKHPFETATCGNSLRHAMRQALDRAGVSLEDVGHVNAHGLSTVRDDRIEAAALSDVVPGVPVTALKSYFGNLGAAGGAMETAASVLAFREGGVPATLNYDTPDLACPVAVIHGEAIPCTAPAALSITSMPSGPAAAVVLGAP